MKIESTSWTEADIDSFVSDFFERERGQLIDRLKRVIERTEALVPSIAGQSRSDGESWTALETLAHMVGSSQFFGWLIYQIAGKKQDVGDLMEMVKLRDVALPSAAQMPPEDLAKQLRDNVERTISYPETASFDDLRNTVAYGGRKLSAEDLARLPLCSHLEEHLEQIREVAGSR